MMLPSTWNLHPDKVHALEMDDYDALPGATFVRGLFEVLCVVRWHGSGSGAVVLSGAGKLSLGEEMAQVKSTDAGTMTPSGRFGKVYWLVAIVLAAWIYWYSQQSQPVNGQPLVTTSDEDEVAPAPSDETDDDPGRFDY